MADEFSLKKEHLEILFSKYGKEFNENEVIFNEGDAPDNFYIIYDGKIKIIKKDENTQTIINVLDNGELFGEMSLIDKQQRSASAVAIIKSKIIILNEEVFFKLMQNQKAFIMNVLKTLIYRTTRLSEVAVKLAKRDEKTRILISLSNIIKTKIEDNSNSISLPSTETIKDISSNIYLTQERIAKHIDELEQMNKLTIDNDYIIIKNIKKFFTSIGI